MLLFRGGPQLCFCEYFRKVLICSGPSNIFFVTYVSREPRILLLYLWLSEIRNLIKSVFQVCFLSWGGRCQDKEQKVKITVALSGSAALLKQTKPFCPCGCRQHRQKLQCQPGSRMALGSAGRDARGQGCDTAHQPHEGQAVNTQQQGFSKNCSSSLHFWGRLLPRFSEVRGLESYVLLVFSLFGFSTQSLNKGWVQGVTSCCSVRFRIWVTSSSNLNFLHIVSGQRKELFKKLLSKDPVKLSSITSNEI